MVALCRKTMLLKDKMTEEKMLFGHLILIMMNNCSKVLRCPRSSIDRMVCRHCTSLNV